MCVSVLRWFEGLLLCSRLASRHRHTSYPSLLFFAYTIVRNNSTWTSSLACLIFPHLSHITNLWTHPLFAEPSKSPPGLLKKHPPIMTGPKTRQSTGVIVARSTSPEQLVAKNKAIMSKLVKGPGASQKMIRIKRTGAGHSKKTQSNKHISPQKNGRATTATGLPRANGEQSSPINGTFNPNQVSIFSFHISHFQQIKQLYSVLRIPLEW